MATVKPFNALRPQKENAHIIASVPYDVVNREEAKELVANNDLSFLKVTRSEIDLPDDVNPYSKEVYEKAKENIAKLKKDGSLNEDDKPHFYLYRLVMDGRAQVGIAATFAVDDYDNDIILKHEKTRKVKEDDRTNHIVTTETQTGIVFLTYRGADAINNLVDKTISETKPEYDFTSPDGIQHTVWLLPDEYNNTLIEEFSKQDKIYVADGHHRAKSASRAREEKRNSNPKHTGDEEYNYFIAVVFPADQLKILPYNRVVFDLNNYDKNGFFSKVKENFKIEKTGIKEPTTKRCFGMYIDNEWFSLKPKDATLSKVDAAASVGEKLDVSILQNYLLNPILGIEDQRTSNRIDFIGGIRGTQELEKLVNSGKAVVAFSMYPVSVDDLMNISDAGEVMPPKSTWFEPKLRDGLLSHTI
jgi:uncharacterized protein (DUF1015 family)